MADMIGGSVVNLQSHCGWMRWGVGEGKVQFEGQLH